MVPKARILAIDHQNYFRSLIEGLLKEEGYTVQAVDGLDSALQWLEAEGAADLVILDPGATAEAPDQVRRLQKRCPDQPVLVLTGQGEVHDVVAAMRAGASDYLLKPLDRELLLGAIGRALGDAPRASEPERLVDENLEFMGRLSLVERALPLLRLRNVAEVAPALLELVCFEARAAAGVLWLRQGLGGPLLRTALQGEVEEDEQPMVWRGEPASVQRTLEAGRPILAQGPGPTGDGAQVLYVPCVWESKLFGVVGLWHGTESVFSPTEIEGCAKLAQIGTLAISNAFEMADLRQLSFREPLTGLPTRAFLELVAETEIHRARRYGRRLACLCVEFDPEPEPNSEELQKVVAEMLRTLRTTDILAAEEGNAFWILATDTDPLGGVVLKRRLAERLREITARVGWDCVVSLGAARYPLDGDSVDDLMQVALARVRAERQSVVHELGIEADSPLAEIGQRLLERAQPVPQRLVAEAADLVIGELATRPRDRGLLFLAPGSDRGAFINPLTALREQESATEVFLATDGDTIPSGPCVTPLALPNEVTPETTWIVRFGEAPAYALVAGPVQPDGRRPVYHSGDPVLVEHLTFRLRSEVGFGVRA